MPPDLGITGRWPLAVDEVLGGDQALALATVTPANGVVLAPVTNFAMRDPHSGTVGVNTSVGMWRKLQRMRRNPRVALAFHTRAHAFHDRPEYVLVQGEASFPWPPDRDSWLDEMGRHNWERFGAQPRDLGPLWERWLSAYHWRVNVRVAAKRVVVWRDLACGGEAVVHGAALTPAPAPQSPPAGGTGPRVDQRRAARRARRLPHVLLGWTGDDGFPVVVPVRVAGADERGMVLEPPAGLVPPGGRRAGLLAHWFARGTHGQNQRTHSGWLEAEAGGQAVSFAPHTEHGYRFPASHLAFRIAAGFGTRRGLRDGRRQGIFANQDAL